MLSKVGVTYDWRLAVPLLEQRDGYFTKLKSAIEGVYKLHKQKVISWCSTGCLLSMVKDASKSMESLHVQC